MCLEHNNNAICRSILLIDGLVNWAAVGGIVTIFITGFITGNLINDHS